MDWRVVLLHFSAFFLLALAVPPNQEMVQQVLRLNESYNLDKTGDQLINADSYKEFGLLSMES